MAKNFKIYLLLWLICFGMFNIITFTSPIVMNITNGSFWIGYTFIILAFLGQLTCGYIAFKDDNLKKMFYNISLVLISYIAMFLILIVGTVCMIIPMFPTWLSAICCVMITGLYAFAIITTCFTIKVVSNIDNEVATKTLAIKKLSIDAEHLISIAQNDEVKVICKKVYEALRYSDPVTNIVLSEINQQIQNELKMFEISVNDNDIEMAKAVSSELLNLIDKRNKECTLLK